MHLHDASINTFTINTNNQGNFQHILNLISFQQNLIPEEEIPFFVEVIQILGISINDIADLNQPTELNDENIFEITRMHERWEVLYSNLFVRDIDYISSNFFKFCENNLDDMNSLRPKTLERIISNNKLKLRDENQLLNFINQIYKNQNNMNYSILYHYVLFNNVDEELITTFIDNFNYDDIDVQIWSAISKRLKSPIIKIKEDQNIRYVNEGKKIFHPKYDDNFTGIINYLKTQSFGNFTNKVNVTASSYIGLGYEPTNAVYYKGTNYFYSTSSPNSWICFEFKENQVIPKNYQIRSFNSGPNSQHPKSWVIEGSKDNNSWTILDEQNNCSYLNDAHKTHIFNISNSEEFRFIRMRITNTNWANNYHLIINSFEIYGKLI